jgi:hypothetical protein
VAASIEQLSFELTAGALAEQERAVSSLRTCASTTLGASSVAGSFLGARAIHGSLDLLSILALISFAACAASAIWVLGPHDFAFAFDGGAVLAESDVKPAAELADAYRAVGSWIELHVRSNARKIANLSTCLTASCWSLAAEIVLWTIGIVK